MKKNVIGIIGAGPAGVAAAIQLKRYGFEIVLFEKNQVGGLLRNANLVENYPGFPKGISGLQLSKLFSKQLSELQIPITTCQITDVDYGEFGFTLATNLGKYYCDVLVIASGTAAVNYEDVQIPENATENIAYEIYQHLNIKNKRVVIVGAGDAAFDYAINISKNNEVVILNRGEGIKCLPLLYERAIQIPTIQYIKNTRISSLEKRGHGLSLYLQKDDHRIAMETDLLIFAIGRIPELSFINPQMQEKITMLNQKGVLYFIGDVTNGIYRQTAISVGNGIEVAMKIYQLHRRNKQ